jgi:hypothetical protein
VYIKGRRYYFRLGLAKAKAFLSLKTCFKQILEEDASKKTRKKT